VRALRALLARAPRAYDACHAGPARNPVAQVQQASAHHSGEHLMTQRLNYFQQSAELSRKLVELDGLLQKTTIEESIRELVEIRASQLNGCAFCVDMHIKMAKIHGERELRLHHVAIWRESTLFSARERAALEWTDVLTHLPANGVPDDLYERVREQYQEKELSDLTFLVGAINSWNRLNVAFRVVPGSFDKMFGLDKAHLE
jgi:AhpD family alkylhydroperoxidase